MIIIFVICIWYGTLKFVLIDEVIGIMPRLLTGKITRVLESKISRPHFSDHDSPLKILNYFYDIYISGSKLKKFRIQKSVANEHRRLQFGGIS